MDLNQAQMAQGLDQQNMDQDVDEQYADEIPVDNGGATPPNNIEDDKDGDDDGEDGQEN